MHVSVKGMFVFWLAFGHMRACAAPSLADTPSQIHTNRKYAQGLQEGAAAAIDKARSLLQDSQTSDAVPPLPRLPLNSSPAGQHSIETSSVTPGAVSWQYSGGQGGGEGRPGNKGTDGRGSQSHVSIAWDDLTRIPRGGQRASVMMEDGSELSVDPQTGRVLNDGEHGGLELL